MKTLGDLEKELKFLRRRVTELESTPASQNDAEVEAIVGGGDSSGGKLSGERRRNDASRAREQTLALKAEISKNPHAAENPGYLQAKYPYVPPAEFKLIVRTAETVLHPRHIDQHFSDDAEITDLISAGLKKEE